MHHLHAIAEDEMVAVFLQTEIASARFRPTLLALLRRDGCDPRLVEHPDLAAADENAYRRHLLGTYRGYQCNADVFTAMPAEVRWYRALITPDEMARVRYLNDDYWIALSGGSRLATDAATRIRQGVEAFGVGNGGFWFLADALAAGAVFPELILVEAEEHAPHPSPTLGGYAPQYCSDSVLHSAAAWTTIDASALATVQPRVRRVAVHAPPAAESTRRDNRTGKERGTMPVHSSIGDYLIARLHAQGVAHVFGVPGDFVLRFYDLLAHSPLQVINTCDEQGAGFAADAYARSRGLGAVCVTYGVGGLKVANATAQAFAERVPVVVISGAPGLQERQLHPLLHHKVREFDTQKKVFEQLTVASTVLDDRYTAVAEIDRVLAAAQEHKRPVYIELPRDMVTLSATRQHARPAARAAGDAARLRAAVAEAVARLQVAQQPVILAGVEVQRFGLQQQVHDLAARTRIPVADTLLGKAVLSEHEPFYLGLYQGAMSRPGVRQYVEASDCVLLLGVLMTDINLGVYTAQLDPQRCISADAEQISIGYHTYEDVRFDAFVAGLLAAELPPRSLPGAPPHAPALDMDTAHPSGGEGAERVTVERLFGRISAFLRPDIAVIADPGDALFAAADLRTYQCSAFIAPAYYCSLGYAVPAALGLQLANPRCRPLVLVGDGAFQMSGLELSTALRFGLTPIVVVLNNGGYGTERPILDGPFNDITPWAYARVPEVVGGGRGFVVETVGQLDAALAAARAHTDSFCLLDVRLERHDISPALRRLTERLAQQQGSALGRRGGARQRG